MEKVPNPITIRDVARLARVGVGTVSRVLNGGNHVSGPTHERVLTAISRLRFRPHAQARRILRRTEMVCFLLSNRDFLHSFHARILQGVETCARARPARGFCRRPLQRQNSRRPDSPSTHS